MEIEFEVVGEVVAKGRPRLSRYGTYTPAKTKNYETKVQLLFKNKFKDFEPMEGPLAIEVDVYMYIPKSDSKKMRARKKFNELRPTKRPDWDNMAKSITDALNGLAYKDDSQIVEATVRKWFGEEQKAVVKIKELQ